MHLDDIAHLGQEVAQLTFSIQREASDGEQLLVIVALAVGNLKDGIVQVVVLAIDYGLVQVGFSEI